MVKFIEIDPNEVSDAIRSHRGRVSYPILKGFLETGFFVVMLDRTGMQQSLQALQSSLRAYTLNHKMPIKVFTRKGEVYLMRLDIDKDGNEIENWREMGKGPLADLEPKKITPNEVANRFEKEKGQTTK
jgi:hypothetical protein